MITFFLFHLASTTTTCDTVWNVRPNCVKASKVSTSSLTVPHMTANSVVSTGRGYSQFRGCIDDEELESYKAEFHEFTAKYRPYTTQIYKCEDKRVLLESNASAAIRATTGSPPLYALYSVTKTFTAFMAAAQMLENSEQLYTLSNTVESRLPMFSNAKMMSNSILKYDSETNSVGVFTYADMNALGWLSTRTVDGEHQVVCNLPGASASHVLVANASSDKLNEIAPTWGVLNIVTNPDTPYYPTSSQIDALGGKTYGIHKLSSTSSDELTNGVSDKFKNDVTKCLVMSVHVGPKDVNDGRRGFQKLVQFGIDRPTRELKVWDAISMRTGHAYSSSASYDLLTRPNMYQHEALSNVFATNAYRAVVYNEFGLSPAQFNKDFVERPYYGSRTVTDYPQTALMMEVMSRSLPVAQPGEFYYGLSLDILAAVLMVQEDGLGRPQKPDGTVDFSQLYDGHGFDVRTRTNATMEDVLKKYILTPFGIDESDLFYRFDSVDDPKFQRLAPQLDTAYAYRFWPEIADDTMFDTERPLSLYDTFYQAYERQKGILAPSTLQMLADLRDRGHKRPDGTINPDFFGIRTSDVFQNEWWQGGSGLFASAEAAEKIMDIIGHGCKDASGKRICDPRAWNMIARPVEASSANIDKVTQLIDNGGPTNVGKISYGMGVWVFADPDSVTFSNSYVSGDSTMALGWGGVSISCAHYGARCSYIFSSTTSESPLWLAHAEDNSEPLIIGQNNLKAALSLAGLY